MAATPVFSDEQIASILALINTTRHTQYIGARYVPIFGRKGEATIEWDNTAPYEPLTVVLHQGNSYTSRQYVPTGIDILNEDFWANTGNYNAQIEQYRQEATAANNKLSAMGVNTVEDGAALLTRIETIDNDVKFNTSMFTAMGVQNIANAETFNGLPNKISNIKVINVRDMGATGDGVTDDTIAFTNAITQAANGVVYVPTGIYNVKTNELYADNITIIGSGSNSVIKNTENTSASLMRVGSNTRIENLSFDINKYSFFIDMPDTVKNVTIKNCYGINGKIVRAIGRADDTKTATNIIVENCTAANWAGGTADGAVLLGFTNNSLVNGCTLINTNQACSGIVFYGGDSAKKEISEENNKCNNIIISNNIVENVEGGCIWGSLGKDIIISNNIVSNSLDVGIDLEGGLRGNIANNTISDCKNGNIALINNVKNCKVNNNISIMNETPSGNLYKRHFMCYKNTMSSGDDYTLSNNEFITNNNTTMCEIANVSQISDIFISENKFINTYINISNGSAALNATITKNIFNNTLTTNYSIESNDCTDSSVITISENKFNDTKSISVKTTQNFNGRGSNIIENNTISGDINIVGNSESGTNAVITLCDNTFMQTATITNSNPLAYLWYENNHQLAVSGTTVRRVLPYPNTQPTSGLYFSGQRIYYAQPTTAIGIVATKNGATPEWKTFGAITQ